MSYSDRISKEFEIFSDNINVHDLPKAHDYVLGKYLVKELEKHLGFKLNILRPPHCLTIAFLILLLASFVKLFFNWQIGLLWFAISIGGLWVSNKTGNELDVRTIGQVAEKMTRENYLKSRRNSKTFNKREIERVLVDLFSNDLGLDKSKLKREAKFYNIERE